MQVHTQYQFTRIQLMYLKTQNKVLQDLQEKKKEFSRNSVILEYSGDGSFIQSLPVVESVNDYGNYMDIHLHKEATPSELFRLLSDSKLEIRKFEASETTLNEIFIDIVGKHSHEKSY